MSAGLVCLKDGKFLRTKKIGVYIEEGMPTGRKGACTCRTCATCHTPTVCDACGQCPSHAGEHATPDCPGCPEGKEIWQSYKLWVCDLFECPACGFQLAAGFPRRPSGEHFMPDYAEKRERCQPLVRVDDCGGARP